MSDQATNEDMLAGSERRKAPGGSRLAAGALRYMTTAAEHGGETNWLCF